MRMPIVIAPEIQALAPELVALRRDFHRHPELGFQEERTSRLVAERLEALGFAVQRNVAKTGVVARLVHPARKGPILAFRADMDALPLTEANTHDFVSLHPGAMHACGHDGHMAILLGFARWLSQRKARFPGEIRLLFQPAEEGLGGAAPMIAEGALEGVGAIVGLHLWSGLKLGYAGVRPGPIMATCDEFVITVHGKGGHAARPQETADAVLAASQVVVALQTIVSRAVDPLQPAVVTVGQIAGGSAHNIIADRVELRGTARTFDRVLRRRLPELIRQRAEAAAAICGATVELQWIEQYPPTINDARMAELVRKAAETVLGKDRVGPGEPTMGAEDMAYYLEKIPGCFFFLGAGNPERGIDKPHHNPRFDLDEEALPYGVAIFAAVAERFFAEAG
ncbi:MAG: amidohydrolase [Myxococcales bacterium]|nr:MAG: amidohydrolase [Myxococcales bacterium]